MKKLSLPALKLIGLTCRTSLHYEMDLSTARIPEMLQRYFSNQSSEKIPHRISPGTTYCVYTNYESDYTGEYDYFIGEVVSSFEKVPEGFSQLTIPTQQYIKMTAGPGQMPQVCIDTWQTIWRLEAETPSPIGKRNYIADFEVYDDRAVDPAKTTLDIYVGIIV